MSAIQVHLDTDIGGDLDDLCALALLLSWPDVALTGVTTVLDDAGRRAGYARYACDLVGRREVPVAAGADVALGRFRWPAGLPREADYWSEPVPPLPGPVDTALDLLARSIEQGALVVAIGPVTNLSLLEQREPGTLRRARLCLMGGSVVAPPPGFPDWGNEEDFNFQEDAAAAQHVLESAAPGQVMLVPIEVTAQTWLREADLPALRAAGPLARLIAAQAVPFMRDERIAGRYAESSPGLPADIVNFQHDPLACAVALGWNGARVETLPLTISLDAEGYVCERLSEDGKPVRVVTAVDGAAFSAYWLEKVTQARG